MSDWFKKNLLAMLPEVYSASDTNGDLLAYLTPKAEALDSLKSKIEGFPTAFDPENCPPQFLRLLGNTIGLNCLNDDDLPTRREVMEAIELYRRKGTLPGIERDITIKHNWRGVLEETFTGALRLNSTRANLNQQKIPGHIYSFGVWRIICHDFYPDLRETLDWHRPAGSKYFFQQWAYSFAKNRTTRLDHFNRIKRSSLTYINETFIINKSKVNGKRHLNRMRKAAECMEVRTGVEMRSGVESAATKISRLQMPVRRMRLNKREVNLWRLASTATTEIRASFCGNIYTGRNYKEEVIDPGIILNRKQLGKEILPVASSHINWCFRQVDFNSVVADEFAAQSKGVQYRIAMLTAHRGVCHLSTNESKLNKTPFAKVGAAGHVMLSKFVFSVQMNDVERSVDRIDSYKGRSNRLRLNKNGFGQKRFSNTRVCDNRRTFEIDVDTKIQERKLSIKLNQATLGVNKLNSSVEKKCWLKFGEGKLGQTGFRTTYEEFRWVCRQRDYKNEMSQDGTSGAARLREITFNSGIN